MTSVVGGALVVYAFISNGFFPAAYADGEFISARTQEAQVTAAVTYYDTIIKQAPPQGSAPKSVKEITPEIRRGVVEKLIENSIVRHQFAKKLGTAKQLIDAKVNDPALDKDETKKNIKALYGLDIPAFKQMVLMPQARKELLAAKIAEEKLNFEDWLKARKKEARVIIFLKGLSWNGAEVVAKAK